MKEQKLDNMAKLIETPRSVKPQPSITLTEDELKEIKDWKVGGNYTLELNVELTRLSKGDIYMPEASRKMEASFKVLSASTENEVETVKKMSGKKPEEKLKMDVMKKKMEEYKS